MFSGINGVIKFHFTGGCHKTYYFRGFTLWYNAKMLIMTKMEFKFVRFCYKKSGPTMNFLGDSMHARDQCFVTSQAMHKDSTHNGLPDSSLSDV